MRAVYQFGKLGRLRYISHLDLQRFMQRAIRRADLPVAYSQGFNPHPLISFASALAMGHSSEAELLDVRLAEPVSEAEALDKLSSALPPEMPVYQVRLVDDRHPALMASLQWADYRIALPDDCAAAILGAAEAYMKEDSVIALRKTKSGEKPADVCAMTGILKPEDGGLYARLRLTESQTLKPDLLLSVLSGRAGVAAPAARVHRTALLGEVDGAVVPLIER